MIQIFVRHPSNKLYTIDIDPKSSFNDVLKKLSIKVVIPEGLIYFTNNKKYIKHHDFKMSLVDFNITKEQTLDMKICQIKGGNIFIHRVMDFNLPINYPLTDNNTIRLLPMC